MFCFDIYQPGTNVTEIFDGQNFSYGPTLPSQFYSRFCLARIHDKLTFLGFGEEAFLYDWDSSEFITVDTPLFPIFQTGCGTAVTSSGNIQVVVAGMDKIARSHG